MGKRSDFALIPHDLYPTPLEAAWPLIPHLKAAGVRQFSEPCVGKGDLVRHLESHGLTCGYTGDIVLGQDALLVERFDDPPITNPPFSRKNTKLLLALIRHFIDCAPFSWLLLPLDRTANQNMTAPMRCCTNVVPIGRVKWIEGSTDTSKDNFAWYRFESSHSGGPIFHPRGVAPAPARAALCGHCGAAYQPLRTDSMFCSSACRQRAYRQRLAVT